MHFRGKLVNIRAIEQDDLGFIAAFHNDPEIARSLEFSWPISMEQQDAFLQRNLSDASTKRLIVETDAEGVIGYTGFWGIDWINRRATHGLIVGRKELHGRGYGTDIVMTCARIAFEELCLNRLEASIFEFNHASLQVYLQRCGWVEEGRMRKCLYRNGRFHDVIRVGILADEYRQHVAKCG